jgi:hypothetical protein
VYLPYRHAHAPARRRDCGTAGAVTRHFRLVEDDEHGEQARRARARFTWRFGVVVEMAMGTRDPISMGIYSIRVCMCRRFDLVGSLDR